MEALVTFLEELPDSGTNCGWQPDLLFVLGIARLIIRILQIAVPFVLIIFGSLDFFKAVIAGDEKDIKAKKKPFVQRVVAAIIILLLPTLVNLVINVFDDENEFKSCWNAAGKISDISNIKENINNKTLK